EGGGIFAPAFDVGGVEILAAKRRQVVILLLPRDLKVMAGNELVRDERRCEKQIALVQPRSVVVVVADGIRRGRLLVVAERDAAFERRIESTNVVARFRHS